VLPSYASFPIFTRTRGPEVAALSARAGLTPDPEQSICLDALFAVNDAGRSSAFEFGIIAARQNMKTGLFKMAVLGWLFVTNQRLTVWSAHEFNTAEEAFLDLKALIENCAELDDQVKHYYEGNGKQSIVLNSGHRVVFRARTKGGGRGLTGDKVVLDEAFALRKIHMGALLPTLSARPDPQVVYGSSAPLADSSVLHDLRDRGIAGKDDRLAFFEWSAPEGGCEQSQCDHSLIRQGCALDNRENWQKANTALGRRITFDYVAAERRALPPDEFARERLGWPDARSDSTGEPAFEPGKWEACAVPAGQSSIARGKCFGVAVTLDRLHASIAVAGWRDDGRLHVEIVEHRQGTAWLAGRVRELQVKHAAAAVVDGAGPASSLISALELAGVTLTIAKTSDVTDSYAAIYDRVSNRGLAHMSYPELESAVAGAAKRQIGDRFTWGRKASTFDISPLEAVTLAAWGAEAALTADYDPLDSIF
jgi:hypothetical protein